MLEKAGRVGSKKFDSLDSVFFYLHGSKVKKCRLFLKEDYCHSALVLSEPDSLDIDKVKNKLFVLLSNILLANSLGDDDAEVISDIHTETLKLILCMADPGHHILEED